MKKRFEADVTTLQRFRRQIFLPGMICACTLLLVPAAQAQRVDENAVTSADDAFGRSIGRETIGLYTASSVRGFSPTVAGNIRIEGLYFDQVWGFTSRIRESTSIRVGIAALGFPFPAPTGIVDYNFRKPGFASSTSVIVGGNTYKNLHFEIDTDVPLIDDTLALGIGGAALRTNNANGTDGYFAQGAVTLRWTPDARSEAIVYWHRSEGYQVDSAPIFIPAGNFLPPKIPRRRFDGPDWASYRGAAINYGAFGSLRLEGGRSVRAGIFHSAFDDQRSFANLVTQIQPDGSGRRVIIADPPTGTESTSGEVLATQQWTEGPRLHQLHASVRARQRRARYDGIDIIDFGSTFIGERFSQSRPDFAFGTRIKDDVDQYATGLAYEGRWRDVGELSLGLQYSRYRKDILLPGQAAPALDRQNPWLYNINAAYFLTDRLAAYGGYTRGLEESGVAPGNASNRNEALPAIITNQRDAGLRYSLTPALKVLVGVFDVRKPYFNLDEQDRFDALGDVRHQGVELSLAGALTPRLNVVAGWVQQRPEATGEGVRLGRVGARPVGQSRRTAQFNLDWRLPGSEALSLDLSVSNRSSLMATVNNAVSLPSRTLVDVGGRYRFRMVGKPAMLRLSLTNLFNTYEFALRGRGAYDVTAGRVLNAYLTLDI